MKHKILIATILFAGCFKSMSTYAQLEVESSNNVKVGRCMSIGTNADFRALLNLGRASDDQNSTWYGIKSHMRTLSGMPTGPITSIYGFADASATTSSFPLNTVVGVYGRAYMTSNNYTKFSAGVAGVATIYGGIGVYGAISSLYSYTLPTANQGGAYAGYFSGGVKVTGTLTASSVTTTSDQRLKDDIRELNESAVSNIQLLRPVEYKLRPDSVQHVYPDGAFEMKVNHYGLLAQEVQKVFPNVVYEGQDGYLSINYTELIPVLIKSVQELSTEVVELKAQVKELQSKKQ